MSTWVCVPCPGSRLAELRTLLEGLQHPRERVIVLTTHPDPVLQDDIEDVGSLIEERMADRRAGAVNISRWWNMLLEHVSVLQNPWSGTNTPHEVLVIGSDAHGSADGVHQLVECLRYTGAAMVGPDWHGRVPTGQWDVLNGRRRTPVERIPGACFMLAGERQLRCDERIRWWYADDDLELQARQQGPVAMVGGVDLHHPHDSPLDQERHEWAEQDRELFRQKWGVEPW